MVHVRSSINRSIGGCVSCSWLSGSGVLHCRRLGLSSGGGGPSLLLAVPARVGGSVSLLSWRRNVSGGVTNWSLGGGVGCGGVGVLHWGGLGSGVSGGGVLHWGGLAGVGGGGVLNWGLGHVSGLLLDDWLFDVGFLDDWFWGSVGLDLLLRLGIVPVSGGLNFFSVIVLVLGLSVIVTVGLGSDFSVLVLLPQGVSEIAAEAAAEKTEKG